MGPGEGMERADRAAAGVTEEQKGNLQALSDAHPMEPHGKAIVWLDLLIATKKQHAAEDEPEAAGKAD